MPASITLPPALPQASAVATEKPSPLHEPWPLQALVAVLQSLCPLQLLMPMQCTNSAEDTAMLIPASTTLPPRLEQASAGTAINPWPLQLPWPLQALLAVLQSLWPLQLLMPAQWTRSTESAAAALLPAPAADTEAEAARLAAIMARVTPENLGRKLMFMLGTP
jgi:hypothetical protein